MSDVENNKSVLTFNPLSANPTKWSNTLKQFVGNLPTNCLSVFDHFVELALKGLIFSSYIKGRNEQTIQIIRKTITLLLTNGDFEILSSINLLTY